CTNDEHECSIRHMVDKRTNSATEAVQDIASGSSIAVGGFGLVGIPTVLIEALRTQGPDGLTIVSNNLGADGFGLSLLLEDGRISYSIGSYIDRKSTRLNSSHVSISYAVFC